MVKYTNMNAYYVRSMLHTRYSRDDLRCEHTHSGVDRSGLDEQPVGQATDLGVESGHKRVHRFDERHLRAQGLYIIHR